jgi:hypothetical protein
MIEHTIQIQMLKNKCIKITDFFFLLKIFIELKKIVLNIGCWHTHHFTNCTFLPWTQNIGSQRFGNNFTADRPQELNTILAGSVKMV